MPMTNRQKAELLDEMWIDLLDLEEEENDKDAAWAISSIMKYLEGLIGYYHEHTTQEESA